MKSAYELALERLEEQGIEKPREDGLPEALRREIAVVRNQAEARLAELEIVFNKNLLERPDEAPQLEADYRSERERVEHRRDRDVETLRQRA